MKRFIIIVLCLFAIGAGLFLLHTPDSDPEIIRPKYENAASQYLTLPNGERIHYRDEGNPDGTVFLLVHGANASIQAWEPLVERLGDDYRLISYDQPGHGLTGPNKARDYTASTLHVAALAVLDEVGVDQAIWVGNSMGGWLTWRAGVEHPDRVSGLVLISPSGAPRDEPANLYLGAKLMQTGFGRWMAPKFTPRSIIRSSIEANFFDKSLVTETMVDRYWELLRLPGNRVAAGDRAQVDRQEEYWDRVSEIDVPVLVLWGEHDSVSPYTLSKKYAEAITDTVIITYDDAGHLAMEEVPDKVGRDIRKWMSEKFSDQSG